eukprot:COSAG04_NODE_648_length_11585_cov_20.935335_12_plen_113_part_00
MRLCGCAATQVDRQFDAVLSGPWYLDQQKPGGCSTYSLQGMWECFYGVEPLKGLDETQSQYGALNYRTAARTLFLRPYLAHFCSFFRHFFAVFSVLTPGFQRVAPKDRGPAA